MSDNIWKLFEQLPGSALAPAAAFCEVGSRVVASLHFVACCGGTVSSSAAGLE